MTQYRHAIVIGASSGIGAELVKQLAASGARVAALGRRRERLDALGGNSVIPFVHDVTEFDKIPALFQEVTRQLGGLDLVIYCAGIMPEVGPDEFNFEKDQQIIATNLLGAMAWLDQAAIRFGNTGSGSIVAIGSVAGDRGRAPQPAYGTSKAALATYTEALRNRLATRGVKVVTIKPGPTDTEMTAHLGVKKMSAQQVATIILAKSDKTGEHYVSFMHWLVFAIIKAMPSPIFRRLKV